MSPGPELRDLESLLRRLADLPWGRHVQLLGEVDSTNARVWELARQGAPEGTTVIADAQSQGRGRHGRRWFSPPGLGLYVSTLLRPRGEVTPTLWTLAAGVAACRACRKSGAAVELEWPNDLVHRGRKVGGVLVEARQLAGACEVVIGTGINVGHREGDFPRALRGCAASLRILTGRPIPRAQVAEAYLRELAAWAQRLARGESGNLQQAWLELAPGGRGTAVRVQIAGGARVRGITEGLDPTGALRVRDGRGEVVTVRQVDAVEWLEG